jgi:hypothetical protein
VEIAALIPNRIPIAGKNRPQVSERSRSNNGIAPDSDTMGMEQALVDGGALPRRAEDAARFLLIFTEG